MPNPFLFFKGAKTTRELDRILAPRANIPAAKFDRPAPLLNEQQVEGVVNPALKAIEEQTRNSQALLLKQAMAQSKKEAKIAEGAKNAEEAVARIAKSRISELRATQKATKTAAPKKAPKAKTPQEAKVAEKAAVVADTKPGLLRPRNVLIGAAVGTAVVAGMGDDGLPTSDTGISDEDAILAVEGSNFNAAGQPVAATSPVALGKYAHLGIRQLSVAEVAQVGGTEGVPFFTNLAVGDPLLGPGNRQDGVIFNQSPATTEDQTPLGRLSAIRESMNKVAEDKATAVDDVIASKTEASNGLRILTEHLASALRAVNMNIPGAAEDVPKIESEIAQINNRIRMQANNAVNADPVYQNDLNTLADEQRLATAELVAAKTTEEKAKVISPISNLIAEGLQVPKEYADAIALSPTLRKPYLPIINMLMGNQGKAIALNTPMDTTAFKFNLYIAGQQAEGDIGLRNDQVALLENVHNKVLLAAQVNSAEAISTSEAYLKAGTKEKTNMLERANAAMYSGMFNAVAQQDLGQNIIINGMSAASPTIQSALKSSYNLAGEFDYNLFIAALPKGADKEAIAQELAANAPVVEQYYEASSLPKDVGLTKFQITNTVRGLIMALQRQDTSLGGLFGGTGNLGTELARRLGVKEKFLNDK